jgi:hypothetical protein
MVISQNNDVQTTGKAENKQQFLTSRTVLTSHINDPTTFTSETYLTYGYRRWRDLTQPNPTYWLSKACASESLVT